MTQRPHKKIALHDWERQKPFEIFSQVQAPHFNITADIDVTRLIDEVKPAGISVFNAVLHSAMTAVNDIPEMRTRFSGQDIYEYSVSDPSFTTPINDRDFAFCEVAFSDDWATFNEHCIIAIAEAKKQTELKENATSDHWTYLTCAPWVHFTALTHPHNGPEDCIPRIAWGKFSKTNGRWKMPLNLQAHHALMDGYHAGQFIQGTEDHLNSRVFTR
ncbi:CatA-like O-acetyltransferase [Sneathiella aquimaris]|uniref:CatA-like O-acetyltransferase n=1 Tax=Sneathiella aquimaris TaxID=2599305 RepID=UPI00146D452B|nr:CatA-like O-acetyltransferase [Sneathiella aquimaris]